MCFFFDEKNNECKPCVGISVQEGNVCYRCVWGDKLLYGGVGID